jgi:antirestriction protein ArdC
VALIPAAYINSRPRHQMRDRTTQFRNLTIKNTLDNSAAYLKGWLEVLKGDTRMIVTAASAAQCAADFILDQNLRQPEGEITTG